MWQVCYNDCHLMWDETIPPSDAYFVDQKLEKPRFWHENVNPWIELSHLTNPIWLLLVERFFFQYYYI
jgi:hypothetical protein